MNTHIPPGDNGTKLMNAQKYSAPTKTDDADVPPATFSARERDRPRAALSETVFPRDLFFFVA